MPDSRSVESRVWGRRDQRGFDGHEKVNGIEYHTATDTRGNVPACVVSAANVHAPRAMPELLNAVRAAGSPEVRSAYADGAYGDFERGAAARGFTVEIVKSSDYTEANRLKAKANGRASVPLPERWRSSGRSRS